MDVEFNLDSYSIDYNPLQDVPIFHAYGYSTKVSDQEFTVIPGKTFILPINFHYFHFLSDGLAQYLLLKSMYPDIKLVVMISHYNLKGRYIQNIHEKEEDMPENKIQPFISLPSFEKELLREFTNDKYLDIRKNNYYFEETIFYLQRINFPLNIFEKLGHKFAPWIDGEALELEAQKLLIKKIKPLLSKNKNYPKKIYSRREKGLSTRGIRVAYPDEEKIIKYFESKGYFCIDNSGMGFIEQVNYFYNATHIAGLSGTNLFNSIFSEPNTKVFEIHVDPKYVYLWDSYFKNVNLIVKKIDLRKRDNLKLVDVNKILNFLNFNSKGI